MKLKGVVIVAPRTVGGHQPELPALGRIANRPIVCHTIDALLRSGAAELGVIAAGDDLADVQACVKPGLPGQAPITYLPYPRRFDLIAALRAAAPFAGDDPLILHFADGLLDQPLTEFADRMMKPGAPDLLLMLHRSHDADDRLAAEVSDLLHVMELNGSRDHLALAGVCLFGPGALRRLVQSSRPRSTRSGLAALVDQLVRGGATVDVAVVRGWQRYQGDPSELLMLNRLVLDRQDVDGDAPPPADNQIQGRVVIDPTANVSSSTILGPCIIGPAARITNAYIGPYTSVGAGAEIEGAEVVGSIVAEGVRIMHVQGRIEGSTIGRHASIFRDFRLPRAMRLHVGEGVELALD